MIALTEQERRILALATPVAESLGLEIVRLRIQGGRRPHLQIMTEREGGAPTNVEDCASLSRALGPALEDDDPIKEAYTLEVSTPGIDRPLTRVLPNRNRPVNACYDRRGGGEGKNNERRTRLERVKKKKNERQTRIEVRKWMVRF